MATSSYIIAYNSLWCKKIARRLVKKTNKIFLDIENKNMLSLNQLKKINPKYIFFPHWSHIIPAQIYKKYNCVIFHMTDLPYGRGGSPLQNLILRGHNETKISAIQCAKRIDAGPVYLKKPLSLEGNAEEIFIRASNIIVDMIIEIIESKILPIPQHGKPSYFHRRKPEQSNLAEAKKGIRSWYDFIRMLDAEDYPNAFIEIDNLRITFRQAELSGSKLLSNVEIIERN